MLLLAAALALTAFNLWDADRADKAAQSAVTQLHSVLAQGGVITVSSEDPADSPSAELLPDYTDFPERNMPAVEIDGYRYIGVLDIPALDLSLPIMEDWDEERLKVSPCRYSGSAYLDDLVICGHNYPQHFSPLKWVPMDTEIIFTDMDGNVFRYAVSNIETLNPTQIEDMIYGDWALTLFTCNTGGQTRCAVRCDRID